MKFFFGFSFVKFLEQKDIQTLPLKQEPNDPPFFLFNLQMADYLFFHPSAPSYVCSNVLTGGSVRPFEFQAFFSVLFCFPSFIWFLFFFGGGRWLVLERLVRKSIWCLDTTTHVPPSLLPLFLLLPFSLSLSRTRPSRPLGWIKNSVCCPSFWKQKITFRFYFLFLSFYFKSK